MEGNVHLDIVAATTCSRPPPRDYSMLCLTHSLAPMSAVTVLRSTLSVRDGAGPKHDDFAASSELSSSSESSSSPELERWGTPSSDLGVLPANAVAHAAAAAAAAQGGGEGAVRSLETSLGVTPSRRDAADRAAAEPSIGLQPLGEVNDVMLSDDAAELTAGSERVAGAPVPASETASAAAGSGDLPDERARRGSASDAQSLRLSVSASAAGERAAGSIPALPAPQPDEARPLICVMQMCSATLPASQSSNSGEDLLSSSLHLRETPGLAQLMHRPQLRPDHKPHDVMVTHRHPIHHPASTL